jgi:hypothetical protein
LRGAASGEGAAAEGVVDMVSFGAALVPPKVKALIENNYHLNAMGWWFARERLASVLLEV